MVEARDAEIRVVIKRCTFQAVLITELSGGENLMIETYILSINSYGRENKDIKQDTLLWTFRYYERLPSP